ncbi:cob(I)yrinic acid a,c-diamide adenosyltransferase [Candidatus Woesearchaeota archaeon CG10_big_fil_rev_8_21_14_0_10_44_13]|nr:MAG: cob(I)yrinic acid a,c-diamide adenosyltransferase [Candidatus Woesearchaeota archaeon CG10_big_fil_rev_8_21_14_0_10_44_13]
MPKKAPIYLWTGQGWGKTTSALGASMRAIGHGYKVIIIQFMKGRKDEIGEYKIKDLLGRNYEIHQFGRKGWVNLANTSEEDRKLAKEGFEFAKKAAKKKPFILFLDEINLAVAADILNEDEVLQFLDEIPLEVHVYMTGRYATPKLMVRADYVNEINMIKGPKKLTGEKGIDY